MKAPCVRRLRRMRQTPVMRALCTETHVHLSQLVYPLFVQDSSPVPQPIASMPGIFRHSQASVLTEVASCVALGLQAFILFPVVQEKHKNPRGSYACQPDGLYVQCLLAIRKAFPEVLLISDVALDPYSSDGHDGLLSAEGDILNDETLPLLGDMAVLHAQAGVDIVAPSDMMDGRVAHIRSRLDEAGHTHVALLAYTAKYASALYGPFREALDSAPRKGDKKTYQMNPRNGQEALEEATQDYQEGADMLMVKPAGTYLDVIQQLAQQFSIPIAAYQVSGEYAMIKTAAAAGWMEEKALITESLVAIRRAGARFILTYFAKQAAEQGLLGNA